MEYSYLTYGYNKGDGTTLVGGLRFVGGENAQTQSNKFKEILDNLCQNNVSDNKIDNNAIANNHTDKNDNKNFVSNAYFAIRNLMSGISVQKRLFYE